MSILSDEDRKRLLDLAGTLADQAETGREHLRTALFSLGVPLPLADSATSVVAHLEDLAFQRGRAIAMLEHCDVLDAAGEKIRREMGEGGA